jgi:ComF family protein
MKSSMKTSIPQLIRDNALRRGVRILADGLIQFLFPRRCPLCGAGYETDAPLCPDCIGKLSASLLPAYQSDPSDFGHIKGPIHFDGAAVCWDFLVDIEVLIHRVKYVGAPRLGRFLGETAAEALRPWFSDLDAVVTPVPLHVVRFRERGFNQSEAIGMGMASRLGFKFEDGLLIRKKHTKTQTQLSAEKRQANVENAFVLGRNVRVDGKTLIVVDDVITTGATLNACARTLKSAGAAKVIGMALARPRM